MKKYNFRQYCRQTVLFVMKVIGAEIADGYDSNAVKALQFLKIIAFYGWRISDLKEFLDDLKDFEESKKVTFLLHEVFADIKSRAITKYYNR